MGQGHAPGPLRPGLIAIWFAGLRVTVHVTAAQSGGRVGVWESWEPRGTALPRGIPHAHEVTSEIAHILTVATPGGFEQLFLDLGTSEPAPIPPREVFVDAVRALGVEHVAP